jgi:toxin-antitoxin system PIN domain toxin
VRAFDTNVLVYATVLSSPHHDVARRLLTEAADGSRPWAIAWPSIYEFLRVVTHPRVLHPPMPAAAALGAWQAISASPSLVLLSESARHVDLMTELLRTSGATGSLVHDAHIAALCIEHGVTELVTGDRDFSRFRELKVHNPF